MSQKAQSTNILARSTKTKANAIISLAIQAHFKGNEEFYGEGHIHDGMIRGDALKFYAALRYNDLNDFSILTCYCATGKLRIDKCNIAGRLASERKQRFKKFIEKCLKRYLLKHHLCDERQLIFRTINEQLTTYFKHEIRSTGEVYSVHQNGISMGVDIMPCDRDRLNYVIHKGLFFADAEFDSRAIENLRQIRKLFFGYDEGWNDSIELLGVAFK